MAADKSATTVLVALTAILFSQICFWQCTSMSPQVQATAKSCHQPESDQDQSAGCLECIIAKSTILANKKIDFSGWEFLALVDLETPGDLQPAEVAVFAPPVPKLPPSSSRLTTVLRL